VGQRRGIGIAGQEPLFVVRLEPGTRRVVVGPRSALASSTLTMAEVNWIAAPPAPGEAVDCAVKLRSAQPPIQARATPLEGGRARIDLAAPAEAIAPGQACVMYQGDRVLGGGWIERRSAPEATAAA